MASGIDARSSVTGISAIKNVANSLGKLENQAIINSDINYNNNIEE